MRTAISPIIKLKNTSGPVRHFTAPIYPPPAGNHRVDHPLIWWRRRGPDQFVRRDATSLRLALTATHLDDETRWRDTITGDVQEYAATAIGICVRQIKKHPIDSIEVDIAVSPSCRRSRCRRASSWSDSSRTTHSSSIAWMLRFCFRQKTKMISLKTWRLCGWSPVSPSW